MKKIVIVAFLAFTSLMAFGSSYSWVVPVTNMSWEQEITLSSLGNLSSALITVSSPYTCSVSTVTKLFAATCGPVGTNEITRFTTINAPGAGGVTNLTVYFPNKSKSIYLKVNANSTNGGSKALSISAIEGNASKSIKTYSWTVPVYAQPYEQVIKLDSINPLASAVVTIPNYFTGQVYAVKRANQAILGTVRTNDVSLVKSFATAAVTDTATLYFPLGSKNIYIKTTGSHLSGGLGAASIGIVATEGPYSGQPYEWNIPVVQNSGTPQAIIFDTEDTLTGLTVIVTSPATNIAETAKETNQYATTLAAFPANIGGIYTNNLAPFTVSVLTNYQGSTTNSLVVPDLVKTKTLYFIAKGAIATSTIPINVKILGKGKVIERSRMIPF